MTNFGYNLTFFAISKSNQFNNVLKCFNLLGCYLYRPKNEVSSATSVTVFQLAINDDVTDQEMRVFFKPGLLQSTDLQLHRSLH